MPMKSAQRRWANYEHVKKTTIDDLRERPARGARPCAWIATARTASAEAGPAGPLQRAPSCRAPASLEG